MEDRIANRIVETLHAIAKDSFERRQGCTKELALITKGIFYANDYIQMCKEADKKIREQCKVNGEEEPGQTSVMKRLEWYRAKGHLYHGLVPKEFFDFRSLERSGTGFYPYTFELKYGLAASQALKALREGPSFLDSHAFCLIGVLESVLEALGQEKFDILLGLNKIAPLQLTFGVSAIGNPLLALFRPYVCATINDIKRGDIVHFANVPDYHHKHLHQNKRGIHAVCSVSGEHPKFTSLGLNPNGASHEEIINVLFAEYNQDPIDELERMTPEVAKKNNEASHIDKRKTLALKTHKMTLDSFKASQGGVIEPFYFFSMGWDRLVKLKKPPIYVYRLDLERIGKLLKAPIKEAIEMVRAWQLENVNNHKAAIAADQKRARHNQKGH